VKKNSDKPLFLNSRLPSVCPPRILQRWSDLFEPPNEAVCGRSDEIEEQNYHIYAKVFHCYSQALGFVTVNEIITMQRKVFINK